MSKPLLQRRAVLRRRVKVGRYMTEKRATTSERSRTKAPETCDWESLGRLVHRRTLERVTRHFAEQDARSEPEKTPQQRNEEMSQPGSSFLHFDVLELRSAQVFRGGDAWSRP